MRRTACLLLALAALAGCSGAQEHKHISAQAVHDTLVDVFKFVQDEGKKAVEEFANKHPTLAKLAHHRSGGDDDDDAAGKRRLLTVVPTVQDFFHGILGSGWQRFLPSNWGNSSFDWTHLGEFDYGSNLGDFLDSHDLKNMTDINDMKDLHDNYQAIEDAFCTPEAFSPSEKVPASCTGPSITISLVPKICVLESHAKQVVCTPAKLVLTKSPGVCVHKYHSASVWEGKECKISGGAGFSDLYTVGGATKRIPMAQFDFEYIPS